MLEAVIARDDLLKQIDALRRRWTLIGPVRRDAPQCQPPVRYFYEPVERAEQIALDFSACVYSPKAYVLPPRETLFRFDHDRGRFSAQPVFDHTRTALVGVHPCDLHALRTLDRALALDAPDEHYSARREHLFLVGVDCAGPCREGVFCGDLGTNRIDVGFDVLLIPLRNGDAHAPVEYGIRFGSDAGRAWLRGSPEGDRTRPPDAADERDHVSFEHRKRSRFQPALRSRREDIAGVLARSYDSLLWDATARRCYSCGSCNLVCPTCYCFDIRDENDLAPGRGARERVWDACMLREFALVAGDHNFRPKAAQRLRHRVYRKGAWIEQRTNAPGCVGCARCDRACTARIGIVEILNQLAEEG